VAAGEHAGEAEEVDGDGVGALEIEEEPAVEVVLGE
jgi:hypothetical protein